MRLLNDVKIIVPLLFGICLTSSYLLYLNLTQKSTNSNNKVIGVLTFKTKSIQRKYQSGVIWETIEVKTQITNKDTIRTDELSNAVLLLNDGTKINIDQKSMIYLDFSEKDINIQFEYGSISANKEGGNNSSVLNIKNGDTSISVKDGDLNLTLNKNQEVGVAVNKGSASLTNNGKENVIHEHEIANIKKDNVQINKKTLELKNPVHNSILEYKSQTNIPFQWLDSDSVSSYTIQVSKSSQFSQILKNQNTNSKNISLNMDPGRYYWRVLKNGKSSSADEYSETFFFQLIANQAITLTSPLNNSKFSSSSTNPFIQFSWTNNGSTDNYNLEVSKDNQFSEILNSTDVIGNSISLNLFGEGTYYARVKAISQLNDKENIFSNINQFIITKNLTPTAPILISPKNDFHLPKIAKIKNSINFSWEESDFFSSYTLEISKTESFENILYSKKINTNFLSLPNDLEKGNYFWRVKGYSNNNKAEPIASLSRKFEISELSKIKLIRPENSSEVLLKNNSESFNLRWSSVKFSPTKYTIDISLDDKFKNIVSTLSSTDSSTQAYLQKFGKYYWRVKLVTENNQEIVDSNVFSFTIIESSQLPLPIFPAQNQKVDMSSYADINFQWEKVNDVKQYKFSLYKSDPTGKAENKLIKTITVTSNSYRFTELTKLEVGNFIWEVTTLNNKKSQTVKTPFSIFLSDDYSNLDNVISAEEIYIE